jgi:transcriptional regulator with XRE-family HTH domain
MRAKLDKRNERLRLLLIQSRKDASLNQTEVASRLGKPQSYVSKIERGERKVTVVEFLDLARALDADPLELIRTFESNKRV